MRGSGVRADSRGVSAVAGGWSKPRRWVPVTVPLASIWQSSAAPRASAAEGRVPSGGPPSGVASRGGGGGGGGKTPRCGWWKRKRVSCSRAASKSW
jgi:hypothetical protein